MTQVRPDSPSTHPLQPLLSLMETLQTRARELPEGSYTTRLIRGGVGKIGEKVMEEAGEMIEAASETGDEGRQHFIYEAGDLLYHTMVLLAQQGVSIDEVATELGRREGVSGLEEKASRKSS